MEEIIKKIKYGDGLTDEELSQAIKHYSKLKELLLPFGERYFLVLKDVNSTLYTLEGYLQARNRK